MFLIFSDSQIDNSVVFVNSLANLEICSYSIDLSTKILPSKTLTILKIRQYYAISIPASVATMESLRWRRFMQSSMTVALVLLGGVTTEVAGFGYLESLTPSFPSSTTKTETDRDYLDSLKHNPEGVAAATTASTTTDAIESTNWVETIAEPPDDHYSKDNPGAGWAGYKHPMYGGYLDNLASSSSTQNSTNSNDNSSSSSNDGTTTAAVAATTQGAPSATTSCVLAAGKKADYGDDIRWGAQVYLDNLK